MKVAVQRKKRAQLALKVSLILRASMINLSILAEYYYTCAWGLVLVETHPVQRVIF